MKAITFDRFGGPEVLTVSELPEPSPGPGQVLVKVAATTVNPTDLMMRSGMQAAMMTELKPPFIAGMEFAGTIAEPGASDLELGQRVIGVVNPRTKSGGAYAEFVAVSRKSVAPLAHGADLVAAATVPMNALTAAMALDLLGLKPSDSLLVTGGAGMLGGSAIQLAKAAGLTVFANVAETDRILVAELGADHILPRSEGLEGALRKVCPNGVEGMIDGALIGREISHLVRDGGAIVTLRGSYKIVDPRLHIHNVMVLAGIEQTATLERIASMIGEGRLRTRIAVGGRYNFRDAAAAHAAAESGGQRGRFVLTFDT